LVTNRHQVLPHIRAGPPACVSPHPSRQKGLKSTGKKHSSDRTEEQLRNPPPAKLEGKIHNIKTGGKFERRNFTTFKLEGKIHNIGFGGKSKQHQEGGKFKRREHQLKG
jgi:hypothetical protein